MTLDEAIKHADEVAERLENSCKRDWMDEDDKRCAEEHRQLAEWLKELKQLKETETCEDCISRNATVEQLCKVAEFMDEKRNGLGSPYVMAALFIQDNKDKFPSVTPKQRWIPVSERLPKEHIFEDGYVGPSDKVQITTVHGIVTTSRYWGNRWGKVTEEAEGRSPEYYDWVEAELWEDDVLAWMPLPKPYKAESEELANEH